MAPVMSQLVGADLEEQFVDEPGWTMARAANLAKLLSEANRYCWTGKEPKSSSTPMMSGLMLPAPTK